LVVPKTFTFIAPSIPSIGIYLFTTDKGLNYEVRFGRKQNDILCVNIVFGVLNDEFDGEEYTLVNKGEFFSVMQTVEAIIQDFFIKNPNIHTFEFAGEPLSPNMPSDHISKRTRVYMRYARKIFHSSFWSIETQGNKVIIERKRN
jgi:hypothetical protein